MSIIIKSPEEIDIIREGGKHLATVLNKVKEKVAPGISTKDLDIYAEKLIREMGDTPAFLNYRPEGASSPFPASLCGLRTLPFSALSVINLIASLNFSLQN